MVLRHLAANKKIMIDLDAKFDMHTPVNVLSLLTLPGDKKPVKRSA